MQVKRDITLDIMNDKQEYDSNTITIIYNENTPRNLHSVHIVEGRNIF